jgi:hypothetical protein
MDDRGPSLVSDATSPSIEEGCLPRKLDSTGAKINGPQRFQDLALLGVNRIGIKWSIVIEVIQKLLFF